MSKPRSSFFDLFVRAGINRARVRQEFIQIEKEMVAKHGYGSKNFLDILEILNAQFSKDGININSVEYSAILTKFNHSRNDKPQLFPGVKETLKELKNSFQLSILTKGNYSEQKDKIIRSGISDLIPDYHIWAEKDDDAYRKLLLDNKWVAAEVCMVGNSPKSDINPALRCGLYAVFIPYEHTWHMDNEPLISTTDRLYKVKKFTDIKDIFL